MEYVRTKNVEIPALGYGTARFDSNDACRRAVTVALETGYRHIDTAQMYDTEGAVGAAISASDVLRDELFVTTKLDRGNRGDDRVRTSTKQSLEALDLDVIDLLLIHSPNDTVPLEETIDAMNELQDAGLVRHIGVSNFSVDLLRRAMDVSDRPILTNQVKYNPNYDQSELLAFCIDEDVMLTAYSPLDVGRVVGDSTLTTIGNRHGKSAAQVALRWLLQQELVSAIPKAGTHDHIRENFDVFDFELSDDEMRRIFEKRGPLIDRVMDLLGL